MTTMAVAPRRDLYVLVDVWCQCLGACVGCDAGDAVRQAVRASPDGEKTYVHGVTAFNGVPAAQDTILRVVAELGARFTYDPPRMSLSDSSKERLDYQLGALTATMSDLLMTTRARSGGPRTCVLILGCTELHESVFVVLDVLLSDPELTENWLVEIWCRGAGRHADLLESFQEKFRMVRVFRLC